MEINLSQVGKNVAYLSDSDTAINTDNNKPANIPTFEANPVVGINSSETKGFVPIADKQLEEDAEPSQQALDEALLEMNEFVQARNKQLNFSVDEDSGKQVVKVTDSESGDVIRQIPTEEVLNLSRRIQDLQMDVGSAVGVFFNKQA